MEENIEKEVGFKFYFLMVIFILIALSITTLWGGNYFNFEGSNLKEHLKTHTLILFLTSLVGTLSLLALLFKRKEGLYSALGCASIYALVGMISDMGMSALIPLMGYLMVWKTIIPYRASFNIKSQEPVVEGTKKKNYFGLLFLIIALIGAALHAYIAKENLDDWNYKRIKKAYKSMKAEEKVIQPIETKVERKQEEEEKVPFKATIVANKVEGKYPEVEISMVYIGDEEKKIFWSEDFIEVASYVEEDKNITDFFGEDVFTRAMASENIFGFLFKNINCDVIKRTESRRNNLTAEKIKEKTITLKKGMVLNSKFNINQYEGLKYIHVGNEFEMSLYYQEKGSYKTISNKVTWKVE